MKDKIQKIKEKYLYLLILNLIIFILLGVVSYDLLNNIGEGYDVYLNGNKLENSISLYKKNKIQYISKQDVIQMFKENVYYDKISSKLIITTNSGITKMSNEDNGEVTYLNGNIYFNINILVNNMQKTIAIDNIQKLINISDEQCINGKLLKRRVEILEINSKDVVHVVNDKNALVQILLNEKASDLQNKFVNVKVVEDGVTYIGRIFKNNLKYKYENADSNFEEETKIIKMIKATDRVSQNTDLASINSLVIDMLKLTGVNSLSKIEHAMPNKVHQNTKIYASINNGQSSSNYDSDILTSMLNSDANRQNICSKILDYIVKNNIEGVVIDFTHFKVSDKDMFSQFIKELAAVLHSNGKKIMVNVIDDEYIDIKNVAKYADYIILKAYGQRTIASNSSGPVAAYNFVENMLNKVIKSGVDSGKIILELSTYSILFTQRSGNIINAEVYDMNTAREYVKSNNIQTVLDKEARQNYFSYKKGITTYKMWIEDEYSFGEKLLLVKNNNLAGFCIFESGMESKNVYKKINKIWE